MLVPLLGLGVGAFVCLENAVKALEQTAREMETEIFPLTRLQRLIDSASNSAEKYIVNAEPTQRDRFIHLSHQVDNAFKNTLPFDEPQERALFIAAQNEWQQARMTSEVIFARTHLEGESAVQEMERLNALLDEHTERAVKLIDQIYDVSHLEIKEDLAQAYAVKQRGLLFIATTCGLGLLTVLVVSIVLARSILVPLGILTGGVSRFGEGELDYRIVLNTRDELGELAKMFNLMASRLEQRYEIVQAITMLAHALGRDVIAEGVETQAQLTQLRALQCKYGQGYFFFKPLDGATAGAMIAQKLSAVSAKW